MTNKQLTSFTKDLNRCLTVEEVNSLTTRTITAYDVDNNVIAKSKYDLDDSARELVNKQLFLVNSFRESMAETVLTKFRYAVAINESEYIECCGSKTWVDDVWTNGLDWAFDFTFNSSQPSNFKLTVDTLHFISNLVYDAKPKSAFDRANLSKLEALGWSMYKKLITKIYRGVGLKGWY